MAEADITPQRSVLARIFLSPDEPRLRAGWRLLIHTLFLIVMVIVVAIPLGIVAFLLGLVTPAGSINIGRDGLQIISAILEVAIFTAATWPARRFLDRRTFTSLGFHLNRHTIPDLLFGIALGGLLMALIYAFESLMGWLHFEAWTWEVTSSSQVISSLILMFIFFIGVGYSEELLSRGYHLQNLRDGLNLPLALLISSAVFGLLHIPNPNATWLSTLGIFFAGVFMAFGWLRTGELWIPIGLHLGWNFFQSLFGFQVSGQEFMHLIEHSADGPVMITGGDFGPEGGLTSWAAMLVGAALIWLYTRGRPQASQAVPAKTAAAAPPPAS